jgi:hypothetical protein
MGAFDPNPMGGYFPMQDNGFNDYNPHQASYGQPN